MPLRDNYRLDRMLIETPHPRPTLREARQASEALLKRAALLAPADRALVELAVGSSASQRQLATVLRMDAGTVTRRLKRLLGRLYDPLVLSLLDPRNPLPPEYRQLGVEHLLQGLSARQLADRHQMPVSQVHRILSQIRGWHSARNGHRD